MLEAVAVVETGTALVLEEDEEATEGDADDDGDDDTVAVGSAAACSVYHASAESRIAPLFTSATVAVG